MPSAAQEYTELARWTLRPGHSYGPWFEALIANEFTPLERLLAIQAGGLRKIVDFALQEVPYYGEKYRTLGVRPGDIHDLATLAHLPVLSKHDIIEHGATLRPRRLPPNVRICGVFSSSGTTGRPVRVLMTERSNLMFSILRHRHLRWARVEPRGVHCAIKIASHHPRENGALLADGQLSRSERWHYIGTFFETGPCYGFNVWNPMPQQLAWLREIQPNYLASYPGSFEEIAFANDCRSPSESISALFSAGSSTAPATRRQVERFYRAPLHDGYGLNEIGRVALRCEAGRYHVHAEHCIVEIADANGHPCSPGEYGRVLITALQNPAMPLIRYDTGDVAQAVPAECSCGRGLPVIGEIAGRFRRFGYLPEGTRARHYTLFDAIEALPVELLKPLRQYQLYQHRDHSFELRVRSAGGMSPEFSARLHAVWNTIDGVERTPLRVVEVEHIEASPSGKQLEFDSAFYPDPELEIEPNEYRAALARVARAAV
jgi:phenylacetate-CoA ligase